MDVVRCSACGEENPARARFCLACGTPIAAAGAPPAPSREVRKTLTVLFADMVGFTALGERLDQESLRRVMDRFYGEMRGAIEREGGTVAKFIGDAVMAVWGIPAVSEDDAVRGVRAAEGMRRALAALNDDLDERWGVRIDLRTGVNTGEVVVDPAKSADLLVGDTVNVAARLEQAAAAGEVLVGSETYRLVRDDARLEPVAPLTLKGKGRPVAAFRLLDGRCPDGGREARMTAPLVGRERELARLRAALDSATAASETRVVTLIGSPGVGKTRLVQDFADELGESATVVTGHCEATGEGLTFLPVAEVVRSGAGIHEGDSAESATHKLGAVLPDDDPDRDRVVERALGLVGLGPPVTVEESFWAVRRFLEGLARLRRLVVLLDDVHWGQPTFLDLIEHLAAWGRDAPVLVVVMARPELREIRASLTERGHAVSEVIALGPLDGADSRALVDRLLGDAGLPPELAERVLETTEGNPLFLGEMLRMLVDDGVLKRTGDQWIAGESSGVSVPPTIHALLSARIERLSEEERSVVERAAVIGQQFYVGGVAALAPAGVDAKVAEHLDRLRRKELVTPEGTLWEGEEVFRFHHVLVRDAAYRSLLKEARADLHERFADWLEGRSGEHEEMIALHLERAHAYREQLGPLDERGKALAVRAATRLRCAGRRALEREDHPAAGNLLLRALYPLGPDDDARLGILADLAETQLAAGDTAAAEQTVEELALRAETVGDEPRRALATAFACQLAILTGAGHVRDTIALATEAAAVLQRAGDLAAEAKAHHVAAQAHSLLGEIAAAEHALDRALVAAREARDRRRVTAVLSGAPRAALWGPSPIVRASGRCLDVVRILRMTPGNRHVEAAALRCQAVLEAMRGRPDAARQIVATCRATLEELGLTLELHELAVYAGIVELLAGAPAAAEGHLRHARDGFAALGVEAGAAQAAALLARALVDQGRFHEAEEQSRRAERHGGEDLKTGIAWRGARAEALARRGEHAEAERVAREAVALGEPTDALADKADAYMALATVLRACGREEEGREAAARALQLYAAKDHTVGAMRARAALGSRPLPAAADSGPGTPLGDREVERVWDAYCAAFSAQDWDAVRALVHDDVVLVDHRSIGWQEIRGIEAYLDAQRSGAAVAQEPELRVARVLEASEDTALVVCALHAHAHAGGGAIEIPLGVLNRTRDGRVDRVELFAPDDEAGMRARYAELRGLAVPEHWQRYCELVAARDWDGLRAMFHADYAFVDRRELAWEEMHGVDAVIDVHVAAIALTPDMVTSIDAVLAVDEEADVNVVRMRSRGTTAGGPAESVYGVITVRRDGLLARSEFFAPEDEASMLARYDELRAERRRGARRRGVPETVRARLEAWALAASEGRFDDIADDTDFVFVDHRRHGSGTTEGAGAGIEALRSVHTATRNLRFASDPLAGLDDGRTNVGLATIVVTGETIHGGGAFELEYISLTLSRDGLSRRAEMFDADDGDAAWEAFDALCAQTYNGVTLSPHAVEPIPPVILARQSRWAGAFNAHDFDAVVAMWDEDVERVDHRRLGWEQINARRDFELDVRAFANATVDATARIELIAGAAIGERWVFAAHIALGGTSRDSGGRTIDRMGWVIAGRGEQSTRHEVFDDEDVGGLLERFDALRARPFDHWLGALQTGDREAARALLAQDFVLVDHRTVGWGTVRGPDRMVDTTFSLGETTADARWDADLIASVERGERIVEWMLVTVRGQVEGAPWEVAFGSVGLIEDGLRKTFDIFEPEDEDGMRAAFAALADPVPT
ncbi:MAG TPA: adenylate/guanylate cyclase domain-containing protein [Solirubrobacteraceae bacterium]|jgi:class 3 adenylate cyclase/ketosteroid isomerase-like protein